MLPGMVSYQRYQQLPGVPQGCWWCEKRREWLSKHQKIHGMQRDEEGFVFEALAQINHNEESGYLLHEKMKKE
jgi:hypothetical protein